MADEDRVPDERAIVSAEGNPMALVREVDLGIVKQKLPDPGLKEDGTSPWIYQFKTGGKPTVGLSSDGIQDAVRALAFEGETVRCDWVRMEEQDEHYAYFLAAATRYCVTPEGRSIPLDSTIRGHKAEKMMEVTEWSGPQGQRTGRKVLKMDPKWYEKGITKSARNAEEALLPEALKVEIKRRAIAAQGGVLLIGSERVPVAGLLPPASQESAPAARTRTQPKPTPSPAQEATPPPQAPSTEGLMWQDTEVGQVLRDPTFVWAKAPFAAAVERILGEGKARPAVLKVELSHPDQPPLDDDTFHGMTLGFVVEMLEAKHKKEKQRAPVEPPDDPFEEPPTEAEFTEAPSQETPI